MSPSTHQSSKPWPMKWVILAIVIGIPVYSFLTLRFRKEGPAYQPYAEAVDRGTVQGLLDAGWRRFPLPIEQPADLSPDTDLPLAPAVPYGRGFPGELDRLLRDRPALPDSVSGVRARAVSEASSLYPIEFTCRFPNLKSVPTRVWAYQKGAVLVLAVSLEAVPGDLGLRSPEGDYQIVLPPDLLDPGSHRIVLAGHEQGTAWSVEVH